MDTADRFVQQEKRNKGKTVFDGVLIPQSLFLVVSIGLDQRSLNNFY